MRVSLQTLFDLADLFNRLGAPVELRRLLSLLWDLIGLTLLILRFHRGKEVVLLQPDLGCVLTMRVAVCAEKERHVSSKAHGLESISVLKVASLVTLSLGKSLALSTTSSLSLDGLVQEGLGIKPFHPLSFKLQVSLNLLPSEGVLE